MSTPLHVVHFHRKPMKGYFSLEKLFATVRKHLPPDIRCEVAVSRFESHGVVRRLFTAVEAAMRQGDVNHITGDVTFLAFFMRKSRTVLTIPDCTLLERSGGVKRWLYLVFWYSLPLMRSACVTVISEKVKQELLGYVGYDPARIHVVYVPVSDEFVPTPKAFDASKPVILQIGTGHNKNLARVAAALKGVPCHLRIVGELTREHLDALQSAAVDFSNASGLSDEQVVREYMGCDMVVFASTYEGFGMPIVEANAIGRPVVTSNVPPMTEVAGAGACFVDPSDSASIRQGILRVIGDREYRDALVEAGFENAKRFAAPEISRQYASIYRSLGSRMS